ncbi:hypothetical protein TRVA0_034S01640 [Trichomonascus vanleenenianus]|uniref:uncharacterized protein n=1 Tax=Trichomonascus vanleenenianus TaxID=2268995 RepID=UPI003ECA4392
MDIYILSHGSVWQLSMLRRNTELSGGGSSSSEIASTNVFIDSYNFYEVLGQGAYCKVRIVQNKSSRQYYALKYMPKNQPTSRLKTVAQERNILSSIRHPYVCNLRYAFQDPQFLYMVIDLMAGDLRYYIKRYTLSESAVRVIIAELSCAVEYLHEQGIVHRDIKPENILLDSEGHPHLADFNVATRLTYNNPVIRGISGTFSYLAPEMHQGLPYTEQVDWWALGIVFYECMFGRVPFRTKDHSSVSMLKLMTRRVIFPSTNPRVSGSCMEAISRLLQVNPVDRTRDCYALIGLAFFGGMTRDELENGLVYPVFVPPVSFDMRDIRAKLNRGKVLNADLTTWKRPKKKKKDNNNNNNNEKGGNVIESRKLPVQSPQVRPKGRIVNRLSAYLARYLHRENEATKVDSRAGRSRYISRKLEFVTYNHEEERTCLDGICTSSVSYTPYTDDKFTSTMISVFSMASFKFFGPRKYRQLSNGLPPGVIGAGKSCRRQI